MDRDDAPESGTRPGQAGGALAWLAVAVFVYLLLVGVAIIGEGFEWISGGAEGAERIFAFARNPVAGAILGTLATALVQSSSTVSSVIVGLVAGGVPVGIAIPMIMGANMGTTITNTIVSLGNLREKQAFRKSFEAATVHDFFNLYSIAVFLPIEVFFHPLERMAGALAARLAGSPDASTHGFQVVHALTAPAGDALLAAFGLLPETLGALLAILAGIAMVIASVLNLGRLLRTMGAGRARGLLDRALGRGPLAGVFFGAVITILVQSSSTTTSLIVPLAGAGVVTLRQVYPFTLGANIGTCVTALLAATAITGQTEFLALQIALVHLLYNLLGVALFTTTPWLKDQPIRSAVWLGRRTESNRSWAFGYVASVFCLLPSLFIVGDLLIAGPPAEVAGMASQQVDREAASRAVEASRLKLE